MIKNGYTDTEVLEEEEILTENAHLSNIILFNDDVNTFEWVIDCLKKYCGHDAVQAEQCAYIVHYNGKCGVKKGTLLALEPICQTLMEKGLSAEIN